MFLFNVCNEYLSSFLSFLLQYFNIILFSLLCIIISYLYVPHIIIKRKTEKSTFYYSNIIAIMFVFISSGFYRTYEVNVVNPLDYQFDRQMEVEIVGYVERVEEREEYNIVILKNTDIRILSSEVEESGSFFKSDKIKLTTTIPLQEGNQVRVQGELNKFVESRNMGQFDELSYNKMKGIDYRIKSDNIQIISSKVSYYHNELRNIKRILVKGYDSILPTTESTIMSAMILGESHLLEKEIEVLYSKGGISHILAISGLHISLIGGAIYKLLIKLRLSRTVVTFLSSFIMLSYGVLTNFSVSTNRSIIMFLCLICGKLIGRSYDTLTSTSLSALIILHLSPLEISNPGFILSYGAILAISILVPIIKSNRKRLIHVKLHNGIYYKPNNIWNKILDGVIVSSSVQIVILPVLMYYFYEISIYSILINVLILPLSSLLLFLGLIAGILAIFSVTLGTFVVGSGYYILLLYEFICNIGSRLPYSMILTGRPHILNIVIYYISLILLILLYSDKLDKFIERIHFFIGKRMAKIKFINNMSIMKLRRTLHFLLVLFLCTIFIRENEKLEVTFLDVGQGDSIFLRYEEDYAILVDGGSSSVSNVATYRISPFLKASGVSSIDYVFITHYDTDHISGILELLREIEVNIAMGRNQSWYEGYIKIENLVLPYYDEENDMRNEIIQLAKKCGITVLNMIEGDRIEYKDFTIHCVYPRKDYRPLTSNGSSTVLSVSYKELDLLLTGDMEEREEIDFLKNNISLKKVDILKVAHHGSKSSTSKELLDKFNPTFSIISAGYNNRYGHPHNEVLERLKNNSSIYYNTAYSGAITILSDGQYMKLIRRFP